MMAGALSTTPHWYIAKRRNDAFGAASIEEFRDRQVTQRNLISLAEVADILTAQAPAHHIDDLNNRVDILIWLTGLAEHGCLPVMFQVDAGYSVIPVWLEKPEKAPPEAFITAQQLKAWIDIHGLRTVAEQITAKCYVPRADAISLLHAGGVKLMPAWATDIQAGLPSFTEPSAVIPFQHLHVPKRQAKNAPTGVYKSYAIDILNCRGHHPRIRDDEEWRKKRGFTRTSVRARREEYWATLSPDEQIKFSRTGPKRD